jgi:hypothetical protein
MRIHNPDFRPLESIAETQPQLHPDLLRLSAMTSQSEIKEAIAKECSGSRLRKVSALERRLGSSFAKLQRKSAPRSVRVGIHYRAVGHFVKDGFLWEWIGTHGEYDRLT